MRKTTIVINAIVAVFFACFLVYTFVARRHLDGLAREFVTEKTLQYSAPIVDLADLSLDAPLVQGFLSAKQKATIRAEIDGYREDPAAYIADLTRQERLAAKPQNANPLLAKVLSIKERIRTFYDNTLAALIADLRIFATSNLCAALIAIGLACWSGKKTRQSIVWFSFLMFAAVLYCSYLYIDGLSFFRILFRSHMGWTYPLLLCVALVGLFLDYGRAVSAGEESDSLGPESR